MKRFSRGMAALSLLFGVMLSAQAMAAATAGPAPGRYVVRLRDGVDAGSFARGKGVQPDLVYSHALRGFAAMLGADQLARLQADPDVVAVERDTVFTALPGRGRRMPIASQTLPTGVNRIDGEQNATAGINGVDTALDIDVAIIDTGIASHADLRVAGGADFSRNGFRCGSKSYKDGNGHGTHVAGTVAAKDDGAGVVGVAPGARLWAVKVLTDSGSGYLSCVIKGVDWVTGRAGTIEVANMSLGGGNSPSLCTAIRNSTDRGVVYAVAAGNSAVDAGSSSPANCSQASSGVLAVAAVADYNGAGGGGAAPTCNNYGADDGLASFSNYGSVVNIAAPGVCIYSTYKGGGYATLSGTSMASPHVAGAAALYRLANPGSTPTQVRDGLIAAAKLPSDGSCGYSAGSNGQVAGSLLYVGTTGGCN